MNVQELMYDLDKRRAEIQDLTDSIDTLRNTSKRDARELKAKGKWEEYVSKDERPAVQLLFTQLCNKQKELSTLIRKEVRLIDPVVRVPKGHPDYEDDWVNLSGN